MKSIWNKETVHWINLADAHIFQQQYNLYFRQLKYFGMHYIADEEVVCDLIQDLWLKIWERKREPHQRSYLQAIFISRALPEHSGLHQAQQRGKGILPEVVERKRNDRTRNQLQNHKSRNLPGGQPGIRRFAGCFAPRVCRLPQRKIV